MNIAISSTLNKSGSIYDLIDSLEDSSINKIEIRCESGHINYDDVDEIKRLKGYLKKREMIPLSIHPPSWINTGDGDEWNRIRSVREVEKCILIAQKIEAKSIILHPSESLNNVELVKKSLREIKGFSAEYGVEILIENTFPGKYGSDLEDIKELSSEFGVGVCFDTSHYFSNNRIYEDISAITGLTEEIHISDSNMNGKDDHLLPGEGKIDWERIFDIFNIRDVDIVFELMPVKDLKQGIKRVEEVIEKWSKNGFLH
ncbi:TIM barrel protein [candidate division WOR-3 bacterium]|nr:TIM barrel protein [candidate division WOR-3 bacterium]